MNSTKLKGDIGASEIVADLTRRGYPVLAPIHAEHLRYDLVADINGELVKIQCKYRNASGASIEIKLSTCYSNRSGVKTSKYLAGDFDCLAIWSPDVNRVLYVPLVDNLQTITIAIRPIRTVDYYYWEDFLALNTNLPLKRVRAGIRHKIVKLKITTTKEISETQTNKKKNVRWPSNDALKELVWKQPTTDIAKTLGVSDIAVNKHCKKNKISKPERGYWQKLSAANQVISKQIF